MHDSIELNDELCLRHLVIMFLVVTIITVNLKTKIVSFSLNHCGASLLCVLLLGPDNSSILGCHLICLLIYRLSDGKKQSTQTLTSDSLHNIYYLFTAATCFRHRTWPSSGSYKLLRHTQRILQVVICKW
jgi:hypothetical protein